MNTLPVQFLPLWGEGIPPGSEGLHLEETVANRGSTDQASRAISGVSRPELAVHLPAQANGAAVLVIPGGGYTALMIDKEGHDAAQWLTSLGITAFVLKHRLPGEGHANGRDVPVQDGQRAIRLIRHLASRWGLDGQRVGVVGFSSGAHLGAVLGTAYERSVYAPRDDADALSARPDFMVLAYGPHSANARQCLLKADQPPMEPPEKQALYDEYPSDQLVDHRTPPTFLMHTDDDDRVDPRNSIRFYLALKEAGLPAELHIFREGGHGVAISAHPDWPVAVWTDLCAVWMARCGVLSA